MIKKIINGILVVVIGLCLSAATLPSEGSAASFVEKKPVGLVTTASKGKIAVSWEKMAGAQKYYVYQASQKNQFETLAKAKEDAKAAGDIEKQKEVATAQKKLVPKAKVKNIKNLKFKRVKITKSCKVIRKGLKKGYEYHFCIIAVRDVLQKDGTTVRERTHRSDIRSTTLPLTGKSTIKNLLRFGISPIGSTMYIWGGGWNGFGGNNGAQQFKTGLSPKWRAFAKKHKSNYSYLGYLFQREKGLDCSGYVGNCVYNVMETSNGKQSYVSLASSEGINYAKRGFGKYSSKAVPGKRKAGDVMTCFTHVWICMGECSDGSAVIMHSSPPMVSLAGTPSKTGVSNSKAVKLARKYMKKYYPTQYKNYPNSVYRGSNYNTSYGRMTWNKKTLADPEGYKNLTANKILADLFGERENPKENIPPKVQPAVGKKK